MIGRKIAEGIELFLKGDFENFYVKDEKIRDRVYKGIKLGREVNDYGSAYLVEKPIKECRPDLVCVKDVHEFTIIDHKVTLRCHEEEVEGRLETEEIKWQLKHYAWRFVTQYNFPIHKKDIQVGVNYIVLSPSPMRVFHMWMESEESLIVWLQEAVKVWIDMEHQKGNVWKNRRACVGKYGVCQFKEMCG